MNKTKLLRLLLMLALVGWTVRASAAPECPPSSSSPTAATGHLESTIYDRRASNPQTFTGQDCKIWRKVRLERECWQVHIYAG